jgi:hypothetical protein
MCEQAAQPNAIVYEVYPSIDLNEIPEAWPDEETPTVRTEEKK